MPIRPTAANVDLDALRHNLAVARDLAARQAGAPSLVLAAVKGDAYGHGAVRCARVLEAAGVDWFGVALVEEGAQLRDAGVRTPVLCLGGVGRYGADEVVQRGLVPVLYDEGDAERLDAAAGRLGVRQRVHLKVDTGMGRLGVALPHWGRFLDRLARFPNLDVEGFMTHFATADAAEGTPGFAFTREQGRRYRESLVKLRAHGYAPRLLHTCNSGGLVQHGDLHLDMVRPGLLLYGVPPCDGTPPLAPVLRVTTQVLVARDLPARASVSYNRSFTTKRPSRIATLPVGYADGYPRSLGNVAQVLVGGRRCPVVGVVCMDLCMVDVTDVDEPVEAGDEVVLLGGQRDQRITVEEIAAWAGTIPYEILCGFSERIPRV